MMSQNYKKACIFGGTGFLGRQIVRELARQDYIVKVATRVPERAFFLKTAGDVGQIVPFACQYDDQASIRAAVRDCDVVINCIGILFEKGKSRFKKIHVDVAQSIAAACRDEKTPRFIHVSALACDTGTSNYARTKKRGEEAVLANFPNTTILRPSVIFGPEDDFFNRFAKMAECLPVLPLIGGGLSKFQPVYVGDVAQAVMAAIASEAAPGRIYELGGPEILNFRDIYARIFAETGRKRALVSLPWGMAKFQGCILGLLPTPPLTADQVESLKTDNIVGRSLKGFKDLGITPVGLDAILPSYLARYRPGGRFGDKKRA